MLELIPELATHAPILSGTTGKRWHMVMDPDALHRILREKVNDYPKSMVTKLILEPAIWVPPPGCRVRVPRPGRMFSGAAMKQMKQMADQSIDHRRNRPATGIPDLLDLLLEGEDPKSGRKMNVVELRDNPLTFIVAGHETTALTPAWSLYLCAFDPKVQPVARAEAQAALGTRAATATDLPALPLIRCVVDEALRMYPPAAFLSRTALKADLLCGREIRPQDTVILPIYAMHRHHAHWKDPDAFDPSRFFDPKAIQRFTYLPFGDGPRICNGASFALQETVIILATLLARFRFGLVPGKSPRPVMILTLRPEGGVWLTVDRT